MPPINGVYIPHSDLNAWTPAQAENQFAALKGFGINAVFTESEHYSHDLIALAHRRGLRFFGGIACFHNNALLEQRPELWPVLENGEQRPRMDWYIGLTPTFDDYNQARLETIERIMKAYALDGFFLDFVRWPLRWERELRPGAPEPLQSSFDPHTIRRFLAFAGLDMPAAHTTTAQRAGWILTQHRETWTDFKCSVITDFVAQARERVTNALLGAYIVPAPDEQRAALVGQRAADLAPHLDYLAPMLYHPLLHQSPAWVTATAAALTPHAPGKVLPVLQTHTLTDDEPLYPVAEWQQVVREALTLPDSQGIVGFTSAGLFQDGRGAALAACLR